jgi:cytoskeletal protein CcmA (bactofilin family)
MDILRKDREMEKSIPPGAERLRDERIATTLSEDTQFSGNLKFDKTLKIEGKFKGDLTSSGTLIIGKSGQVEAEISVGSMIVEGKVSGNVVAEDLVDLRSTAQLFGDVTASKLKIEEGVVFVGHADVQPKGNRGTGGKPGEQSKPTQTKKEGNQTG